MGAQPASRRMNDREIEYYRAVEDHFALLRGSPFLFSPKDFALLNRWWREGVPLAAVVAGIGEVFERCRERGDDVVSSLAYCRHAVARHAKRLARARVGEPEGADRGDTGRRLAELAEAVRVRAAALGEGPLGGLLNELGRAVESLPPGAPAAGLDEELASLEATMLDSVFDVLPPDIRAGVEAEVVRGMAGIDATTDVGRRTERALRRRAVREAMRLPRLEL